MTRRLFVLEMSKLAKLFPQREFDVEFLYPFLKDIPDDLFVSSIKYIIYNEDINQSTNIIKLITERTNCIYYHPILKELAQAKGLL